MHSLDLLVSGSLRIWWTPCWSWGVSSSLCFLLWWSTNECNYVPFGLLIYTQECRPEPSEKAIPLIVLRYNMTLMSPALHPAHQTLQEEVRFQGDCGCGMRSAAASPSLTFPVWKTGCHSVMSHAFPPVRLRNGDTAHPLTPLSCKTGVGLWIINSKTSRGCLQESSREISWKQVLMLLNFLCLQLALFFSLLFHLAPNSPGAYRAELYQGLVPTSALLPTLA